MTKAQYNYIRSMELLGKQIKQSYFEAKKLKLPKSYGQVNKIITGGMGGSQLGVDLVKQLFGDKIKLPITQVRDYNLPKFVDNKTLIFLISYSGDTEEVLSIIASRESPASLREAGRARVANPFVITSGGRLAQLAHKSKIPAYIFKPINNPSGQPRLGLGYTIGSMLAIFKKLRIIEITDNQIVKIVNTYQEKQRKIKGARLLKSLSQKLKNKILIIVASEFLQGNSHIIANQINESAKQLAIYYNLPELNHHLLEGLTFPKFNRDNLYFLFFYSKDYHPRNQKRYLITQQILKKQKIPYYQIKLSGDKISQTMEMLTIGSQLSYRLSQINKVDPNQVPWVDYFKKRLA